MGAKATGLTELEDDLRQAAEKAVEETRKIVKKGAVNVKKDWRARWQGFAHAPDLPRSITFDVTTDGTSVKAEIGPDKDRRQGALGNLLEFGSVNNAPHPGGSPAIDAEEPRFYRNLEDMAANLLEGRMGPDVPGGGGD